ncbi:roadblock/LC7 domain-containing protein [Streptacidiphilus sp. EB103A]|uniref:roadblock/LC7 domain-containing protein n=1 Tax=Streptacidiphilus sp. EB103A TaxID=3156275 RepID=UPI003512C62C
MTQNPFTRNRPDHSAWAERLRQMDQSIVRALFITDDGIRAGADSSMNIDTQDSVASVGSGLHSCAKATAGAMIPAEVGPLEVKQIIVETNLGYLMLMDAGEHTSLIALTEADANLGNVAFSMLKLLGSVGKGVGADHRSAQP